MLHSLREPFYGFRIADDPAGLKPDVDGKQRRGDLRGGNVDGFFAGERGGIVLEAGRKLGVGDDADDAGSFIYDVADGVSRIGYMEELAGEGLVDNGYGLRRGSV